MAEEGPGLKHRRSEFSEWYNELLMKSELADLRYNAKGFLVHRPWSVLCMKEMYRLYEAELERKCHLPVWFPAVIPESNFRKEAEHIEGFEPELFWVTHAGKDKLAERYALRPTSETAMYNMYSLWIRSWRDLPLKLYQSCQVWRCDTKATRPFIRGREFWWIESHDAFATEEEAKGQVREDMDTTERMMHNEFGIPFIFFRRPHQDKFPGAVHTYAADTLMPDGKALQQPSTHLLGQNFSKGFGIKFRHEDGKESHAWQTCYGPCIWRMLSSVVAIHGDDKGLVFPYKIAPVQVVIVPIGGTEKEAGRLRQRLADAGIRTHVDASKNTPGWKFNQWEMKGVPIRIELGPKEAKEGALTVARRDTGKKEKIKEAEAAKRLPVLGQEVTAGLIKKADAWFAGQIHEAGDMAELKAGLRRGGFVRVTFCSDMEEGGACAKKIKSEMQAEVRGVRADKEEKPAQGSKCIACGKKANVIVYVARQY